MHTSDAELWERWRSERDVDAFMELVLRHTGMVYTTCKRVLGNAADAEDLTQECFVELMKAHVRVQDSLAPWLHTVAFRRSIDKTKTEGRRKQREERYAKSIGQLREATAEDMLAHVDEAIAALPETMRTAIVERFLEGKTHQQVADALAISESTVRYRINQGLERIRDTLRKRGVALSAAVVIGILETRVAQAAPPGLTASIAKMAIAHSKVPVAGAATGVNGIVVKMSTVLVGLVALVGIATYFGMHNRTTSTPGPRVVDAVPEPVAAQPSPVPEPGNTGPAALSVTTSTAAVTEPQEPETPPDAAITGYVVDQGGFPIVGARVVLATWASGYDFRGTQTWAATTDNTGHYAFTGFTHSLPYDRLVFADLSASAPGFTTAGKRVNIKYGQTIDNVAFTLSPGATLRGRVVTPNGAPVAFATVNCRSANTSSIPYIFSATDKEGRFLLGFHSPGTAALLVTSAEEGESLFYAVPVGTEAEVPLQMEPSASLAGHLTWSDGTPAKGVLLSLSCRYPETEKSPNYADQVESYNAFENRLCVQSPRGERPGWSFYL